ncbi:hypothetical protein J7F01_37475 [Streptomyces sp. ISL-22]|uniref:hypothetical protein n=1 Tax=unclassified Streptomyces TaxID=2593676 RepID=UPI001BE8546C|nr:MULTISPECIES: hypothetical protein [unclassified Streptomyces]MBT2418987.1 hypothetical protein [Streptomyces sp. ISL-24]MBT2437728.1 hypothetical protein [Streptomyces sp. ISL-22]
MNRCTAAESALRPAVPHPLVDAVGDGLAGLQHVHTLNGGQARPHPPVPARGDRLGVLAAPLPSADRAARARHRANAPLFVLLPGLGPSKGRPRVGAAGSPRTLRMPGRGPPVPSWQNVGSPRYGGPDEDALVVRLDSSGPRRAP